MKVSLRARSEDAPPRQAKLVGSRAKTAFPVVDRCISLSDTTFPC
ncbi:protein of unassigned function [Methylobacterium oryzae CBMB20]|uniref:Protein of unassigned function n=1 Tax=Methylobacterium oryzae CBMB20 TaxID=693986 RepID=A0A089NKZ4_9HYPH|nr:protein of unassigned function [Methylobacterium oryzae CBMB20]